MGKRVNLAELAVDEADELDTSAPAGPDRPHAQTIRTVASGDICVNPLNKRTPDGDGELEEMAETIRTRGVIQPLVVCSARAYCQEFPDQGSALDEAAWVVLIGNRRLLAARRAELEQVPVLVHDEHITSMYEVMLIENGHRRALSPLREAEAMSEALARAGMSQRELARRIGYSHPYVTHRLALLGLIPELRAAVETGELTLELARGFGDLPVAEQQEIAAAGPPYRRPGGNAVTTRRSRSIRVSNPATAADSIRQRFSPDELAELIRLLTTDPQADSAVTPTQE